MKQKKKKGFFKKHYSLSWLYIKESKKFIWFVVAVFILSALLAVVFQPPEIVELIQKFIEDLLARTDGLNIWQMTLFILDNNLKSSFFAMMGGIVLGIFPIITSFSNGYVLGFVAQRSVEAVGVASLWRLVPHGIFEFPALIFSLALGTKLGFFFLAGKGKIKKEFMKRLEGSLRVFLFVILPLLIVAAIIEGILIFFIR